MSTSSERSARQHLLHVWNVAFTSKGRLPEVFDLSSLRVQLRRAFGGKHLLTKPCIYLHVVEGSPLELVELLLLESSLSGGCSEHIGVGQAGKASDIKSVFSKAIEFLRFV